MDYFNKTSTPPIFVSTSNLKESLNDIPLDYGIELRLDLIENLSLADVASFFKTSKRRVMLTLRSEAHGGKFQRNNENQQNFIQKILSLQPSFCDLEYDLDPLFLHQILKNNPEVQFVLSYHNSKETPQNLDGIYQKMTLYPAQFYKIAAAAHSFDDVIRMFDLAKYNPKLSTICIGEKGAFLRILTNVLKNKIQFASIGETTATAPGQICYQDLDRLYRYTNISPNTALYGLIGDPINASQGHVYHNQLFAKKQMDAVYIKMPIKEHELDLFFRFIKQMPFQGLSVTMPLKEKVIPFLDELDSESQITKAVNTIVFQGKKLIGKNTDGLGALKAIKTKGPVKGKTIVILGAGGSAKAIAFAATQEGANVLILNRTQEKAIRAAQRLGCQGGSLADIPSSYDLLINCTSDPLPIDPSKIHPGSTIMDITYVPKTTQILKEALQRKCQVIYGEEMFFNQASEQRILWGV